MKKITTIIFFVLVLFQVFGQKASAANSIVSPDTTGDVGRKASMALDASGFPVIAYYDATTPGLKILHCGNANCTSGNSIATPDSGTTLSTHTDQSVTLKLDSSGFPVVAYGNNTVNVKILHCGNANCTSGNNIASIATAGGGNPYSLSMVLNNSGYPIVDYMDDAANLYVLACGNANCTSGNTTSTVETTNVGYFGSIALDSSGFPVIAYRKYLGTPPSSLKLAHCGNATCSSGNIINTVDATGGDMAYYTSIVLDSSGFPVISYVYQTGAVLKLAHCTDVNCAGVNLATVDSTSGVYGYLSSVVLDSSGFPVIAYRDAANLDLKVAHCGNANCTSGNTLNTVDSTGDISGSQNSLKLDSLGFPIVAYYDTTNGDLKVAHCVDANCVGATTSAPTINPTPTKTSIAAVTATLGGNVTADGGATVSGRGVCVGTSSNPAIGGTCFTTTGTTGVFTVAATSLSSGTLYHYRAYATNSVGTSYTTDGTFTTGTPTAPAVTTSAETNVDSISTTLNGTVNPNYGTTNAWYFWGTSNVSCSTLPNATTSQSMGSGASPVALTAALSGFTPGVTYYYCAVALNSVGMTYSAVTSFVQTGGSACSSTSLTGNYTASSSCVFGNGTNDGVDAGTGTQNDGVLTVAKGTTLTVGASQTVAYGIIYKPGATVVRLTGGSLRRSSIWVPDTDGDGYPDNVGTYGQIVQATQPAGYSRRAVIGGATVDCAPSDATSFKNYVSYTDVDGDGYTTTAIKALTCGGSTLAGSSATSLGVDCLDSNANVYTNQNVATDVDQDSYSTGTASSQCAGASQSVAGRTYYKDASGAYSFIASANIAGTSDCLDSNANIYQNVSVGTDVDQDGYSTSGASSQCVGVSSTVSGRTYYKNSAGAVTQIAAGSILATADCNDSNATVQDSKVTYVDADGDGLTVAGSTLCLSHATGASVSCSTNYSIDASSVCYLTTSAGADCNDNIHNTYAYAWGENIGWINLASCNGGVNIVNVSSSALTGYAWTENAGWISFNCSNTSSCGTTNYSVANTSGTLSGYAWAENIGWISFNCSNTSSCATVNYKVSIDSTGAWSGWAWSENAGWISFNCSNTSSCGTTSYYTKSAWHP